MIRKAIKERRIPRWDAIKRHGLTDDEVKLIIDASGLGAFISKAYGSDEDVWRRSMLDSGMGDPMNWD